MIFGDYSAYASRTIRVGPRREILNVTIYNGSCHCGGVTFRIRAEQIDELTTCDCSLCARKNALMLKVHEDALTILSGEELLSLYQWNTRQAKHYFCSRCGIYTFHRKRPTISASTSSVSRHSIAPAFQCGQRRASACQ